MSWLSKAAKSPVAKAIVNPVGAGIEKLTGISQANQFKMGAAIGTGMYALKGSAVMGAANNAVNPAPQWGGAASNPVSGGNNTSFNPWSLAAPVVGAAADIWSANKMAHGQEEANATNLESARENMAFQASQTQQQEAYQTEMSNTAHQREVADLKAAGLNPVLSANSGASTPVGASGSGAQSTVQNAAPNYAGIVPKGIDTALKLAQMKKDFESADSSIALNHAAALREQANAKNATNSAREAGAEADMAERENNYLRQNPKYFQTKKAFDLISPMIGTARDAASTYRNLKGYGGSTSMIENFDAEGNHRGSSVHTRR